MEIDGRYTESLKQKAIREITLIMQFVVKKDLKKIMKLSSLSWYDRCFKRKPVLYKKDNFIDIPVIKCWDITKIIFHTNFVIEVFCKFFVEKVEPIPFDGGTSFKIDTETQLYTFKMMAERKAYHVDEKSPFRFIPDSFVSLKNQS